MSKKTILVCVVRGTAFDQGNATLEPDNIAARFWEMLAARKDVSTIFG